MRIKKMRIKNYRRFKDTTISFSDNLTILAGANNSGKTSLIYLLDCIMGNSAALKPKDISVINQSKITNELFNLFESRFKQSLPSELKELKEQVYELFFDKKTGELKFNKEHVSVQITISYETEENISLFAQYLMDLDENKKNFYFEVVQEVNTYKLKNSIEVNLESLQTYLKRYFEYKKEYQNSVSESVESEPLKVQMTKAKQLLAEKIFEFYGDSLEVNYGYTNEDFKLSNRMEKRDFTSLFNYYYLSADRQLGDNNINGKHILTASVVDLLNIERKQETSPSEWKGKVQKILDKLFSAISTENIDTYLVEQAENLLDNISNNINIGNC